MSDDDTSTVWQKVRRKRTVEYDGPEHRGPDRRGPEPATVADYMKFLPLLAAVIAGGMGYARMESKVETLEKQVDKVESWNLSLSERLRDHKDRQH